MADFNQFGSAKSPQSKDTQYCAQCEAMLADALDGTLAAADQAAFDLHMVGCESCSAMLADARRGAAWMEMLKSPRPEPPTALLDRILAETSGINSTVASPATQALSTRIPNTLLGRPSLAPASHPAAAYGSTKILPFRSRIAAAFRLHSIGQTLLQPRLAMTAAMAFFSLALTLNLTGIRLSDIHASDFKPSSILRSAYQAKARVVRYSDNLRVVYELESRVRDLQRQPTTTAEHRPPRTLPIQRTPIRSPLAISNRTPRSPEARSQIRNSPARVPSQAPAAARPPAARCASSVRAHRTDSVQPPLKLLLSLYPVF